MAIHKVQAPDGSILEIEGPDDATPQELIDVAQEHFAKKQATQPINQPSSMDANSWLAAPAALGATGAAIAAGKAIKDRIFSPKEEPVRIEPKMDVNQQPAREPYLEAEKPVVTDPWEAKLSPQDRELLEKSRANAAAKAQMGNIAPPAQPGVIPSIVNPTTGNVSVGIAPPAMPEPTITTTPVAQTAPAIASEAPVTQAAPVEPTPVATKESKPSQTKTKTSIEKTPEERIAGAKNWFLSHFGGKSNPEAQIAYDRLVKEVLNGKPPMMGPSGGVPPEFNDFKKWYETNLAGPPKPSREYLKAARSIPPRAVVPPTLQPQPQLGGGGGASLIRGLTDPLQLKQ